ncbi:MAG: hypothetical protein COB08_001995 [Rhodobacteraceae bacterium]|nr:hypothetical protein [Paracoccaceae bacterium]
MWKKLIAIVVISGAGYAGYDYYKGGFFSRPPMPEGAFSLSYVGGFRGILVGIDDERTSRKYFAIPRNDVPKWFLESWSTCVPPSEARAQEIFESINIERGSRLDAICSIDADGEIIERGLIISVPKYNFERFGYKASNRIRGSTRPKYA